MGIFDFFLSEEERIRRQQRTLTNRDKQPEDRETAARWLADNGSPKALVALLTRFDMSLENQLKDKSEKERVYGLLAKAGQATLRPLERHLEKCRAVPLPLKLLVEIAGEEAAIEKVFRLLEAERGRDDFNPEKKIDLLVWLVERRHPRAIEVVAPLLEDFDEGVRYAAAEVCFAQQDDAARPLLEKILRNPAEESNRLRVRVGDMFAQRRWPLELSEGAPALPAGFSLREGRLVAG